ncbi:SCO family protein [Vicingaceae bacterium]|nr:SCO family protein [Vicingaceae bacterium]
MNKTGLNISFAVMIIGVFIAYKMLDKPMPLKIYSPKDLNPELVDEDQRDIYKNHRIRDFKLVNQDGVSVTDSFLKDKIYVADFFFTTCPTICPAMSNELERVQEAFEGDLGIQIVSHTVQPEYDSPEILKEYAALHKANLNQWTFLTGDKSEIYSLARKSYFAVTTKGDGGIRDFIHTENFVLVDKKKRIRGFYDGTSADDVNRLIKDIKILKDEV